MNDIIQSQAILAQALENYIVSIRKDERKECIRIAESYSPSSINTSKYIVDKIKERDHCVSIELPKSKMSIEGIMALIGKYANRRETIAYIKSESWEASGRMKVIEDMEREARLFLADIEKAIKELE